MARAAVIILSTARLLGAGHERDCFVHPSNDRLVIKVTRPGIRSRQQNRIDHFYLAALERRGVPSTHLPRQHGFVQTDRGEGLVLDRIVNADGSDAQTLPACLTQGLLSRREAMAMVDNLYVHFMDHGVVMVDATLPNLVCQRSGPHHRAVVIDGLGSRHLGIKLKLRSCVPALARWKLRKQWPLLLRALERTPAQREA